MNYFLIFTITAIAVTVIGQELNRPPFLTGASDAVVKEFYDLLKKDEQKTEAQIDADVEKFVVGLGGNFKVYKFREQVKAEKESYEKAHQAVTAKFSPDAKKADAEMSAVADDPNLNDSQKREKIKNIMDCNISNTTSPQTVHC
ncbi:unnamed protein product [Thelazia callipaeda]|uniref:DUF148 domain-containing protein n=1 Tax=Thelazia callipaeda TaxID=103827 RepID=A0A0N5CLM8_THECL|nr:unnamed protein product [Thelazia callipaeda]